MNGRVTAPPVRVWLGGTAAIDVTTLWPDQLDHITKALTLTKIDFATGEQILTPYFILEGSWLHVPRGWFLASHEMLGQVSMTDDRSDGRPLPAGLRANAQFGVDPYPVGQPKFFESIVAACRQNGHGGLALAPTRAGKTLCSLEAAARLGGSTLILLDRGAIMEQFANTVEKFFGVECGIIRQKGFDCWKPFTIATTQTLANRMLPDDVRRAWRTVIVDECQSAPASTFWRILQRIKARYFIGLTATPDRADGLGDAIPWIIGPPIAHLHRKLSATVHFLRVPWAYEGQRISGPRGVIWTKAEKLLAEDPARVNLIVRETVRAVKDGRRVLIMCGLRAHINVIATVLKRSGIWPGIFIGGHSDRSEMDRSVVLATYGIAAKGIDFDPPPTLLILAGPRGDVRQAAGRVLQPHAPHTPMILDFVDWTPQLIKQALRRRDYYRASGFEMHNDIEGTEAA